MNHEPPSLEAELRALRAAPLDEDFLRRLEACADGTFTQSDTGEKCFEALLRETRPSRPDPRFLAEMENIFAGIPFPVDEKIVLFPKANSSATRPNARRPLWAAAAAVALIGAASALLVPPAGPAANVASRQTVQGTLPLSGNASNVVPASFNRGVSEVNDEGVVWKGDNQPHSVIRVVYKDKITVKDKDGRSFQVESPRVQYMTVPARTD